MYVCVCVCVCVQELRRWWGKKELCQVLTLQCTFLSPCSHVHSVLSELLPEGNAETVLEKQCGSMLGMGEKEEKA